MSILPNNLYSAQQVRDLDSIIGGLVTQKMSLIEATTQGVYIHGLATDLAAKQGERGLLSSDLIPFIRKLVN